MPTYLVPFVLDSSTYTRHLFGLEAGMTKEIVSFLMAAGTPEASQI